ncbi:aminoacyl-tRNA hydrolase [Kyrpidia spormannii]|uniref:Peptidyl-tRNA hydrolase n=1 Tax=Kyrpidia spormannii TaxID=2055160 RepID=A0A2K8N3W8_9BACL|nr:MULTISPECIES: aminoacyl-tRNA hydrolase [Kyrpidia]ATY83627.1 aminoacyl-tRNA hydrolase [Kyrpidia spormannii]MCL6576368.1 aminoacyl-tRNA hydrolase [Kyrpidia sp.]
MWLIAGLGNPGPQYAQTRHNAGFMVIDRLAARWSVSVTSRGFHSLTASTRVGEEQVLLLKPQTFMNESGLAVGEAMRWYRLDPECLIVVYDDMDLPPGKVRLRYKGSSGGHNGMKSILQHLGTETFGRVRIGIGRPMEGRSVIDHVLSPFSPDELSTLHPALDRAVELIEIAVQEGFEKAISKA